MNWVGVRAWCAFEFGWTEQQFNEQRVEYINELLYYKTEINRKQEKANK